MQEHIRVTGIILKQTPVGEYDRRVCLLTKERGKISAFARGARKAGNRFGASTLPFCFGSFSLYEGRSAYTLSEAEITRHFEELMTDYIGACYASYFSEVADYITRENNDEREMLKLLYQSLRALTVPTLDRTLIQSVYELKTIVVNGEYPGPPTEEKLLPATKKALDYIAESPVEKLYSFALSPEALAELSRIAGEYNRRFLGHNFKSLEILKTLG